MVLPDCIAILLHYELSSRLVPRSHPQYKEGVCVCPGNETMTNVAQCITVGGT